jgi:UDP-glucose 4-epimerase
LAAEQYFSLYSKLYGLETLALRYFNVFGPGQPPFGPYAAAIPRFLWRILNGHELTLFGDGEQTRDFLYVDDVVQANLLAANATGPLRGESLNVASGQAISLNQLVLGLERDLNLSARVVHGPPRSGDVRHSVANIDRIHTLLGFEPKVPLAIGLQRTRDFLAARI